MLSLTSPRFMRMLERALEDAIMPVAENVHRSSPCASLDPPMPSGWAAMSEVRDEPGRAAVGAISNTRSLKQLKLLAYAR